MNVEKRAARLTSLGSASAVADGKEQTICERGGGSPSEVSGYIDLSNMADGDTIIIKFYAKVKADGEWCKYNGEEYKGIQLMPLLHIVKKPENHGLKISLEQTVGSYKSFDYEFFEEV